MLYGRSLSPNLSPPPPGHLVERRNAGPAGAFVTDLDSPKAPRRVTIHGDTAVVLNPPKDFMETKLDSRG